LTATNTVVSFYLCTYLRFNKPNKLQSVCFQDRYR